MSRWSPMVQSKVAVAVLVAFALSACASTKDFGGDPGLVLSTAEALPAPTRADAPGPGAGQYLVPYDKLELSVLGVEGLEKIDAQVDTGGFITFPIIGEVAVAGKTISEVREEIAERLRQNFLRNPQVTVNLKEMADRLVTVEGQVEKPGSYPIIGRMTLLRALANAGSPGEFARTNDVVVFRDVGGQRYAALYNVDAVRRGAYPDPDVFANDVIVVGDAKGRRIFKDFLQLVPLITTPLVLLLQ